MPRSASDSGALSGWLSQFVGGTQIERQRDEGHRQLDSQSGQVDLTHSVLELLRGVGIEQSSGAACEASPGCLARSFGVLFVVLRLKNVQCSQLRLV